MQFKNNIGQEATKKHLIDLVHNNRLSHALLFLGREGSGAIDFGYCICTIYSLRKSQSKIKTGKCY